MQDLARNEYRQEQEGGKETIAGQATRENRSGPFRIGPALHSSRERSMAVDKADQLRLPLSRGTQWSTDTLIQHGGWRGPVLISLFSAGVVYAL